MHALGAQTHSTIVWALHVYHWSCTQPSELRVLPACRLVADLAAQLVTLGPWKVVYDQLRIMNGPWFDQHATQPPEQLAGKGKWSVIPHGCCIVHFLLALACAGLR